jgi:PEP-CTERM motif
MSFRRAFLWSVLLSLLGGERMAKATFVAADFQFETSTNPTFMPGDVVVFNGKLTNLSSAVADFGGNIAIAGSSYSFYIGGVQGPASPYYEGVEGSYFPNQSIAPGQSVVFPFLFVDTTSTIPLGTIVSLENGNFLFQNIPPSTADPYVDFFIPYLRASSSMSVPEPSTLSLALASGSLLALLRARRVTVAVFSSLES